MHLKRTKIVCTIGPACGSEVMLEKLVRAGMNVARLNFSHGTHADHKKLILALRKVSKKTGQPITILQDLQGPKVRVGDLPKEGFVLKEGAIVVFTTGAAQGKKIPVGYKKLHEDVKKGDRILLDDGLLEVEVVRVRGKDVSAKVILGGLLTSHKGMNITTASLSLSVLSPKDRKDLVFGVEMGVDVIALSFVRTVKDIQQLRRLIAKATAHKKKQSPIMVIAKIEKHEALQNIDAIIQEVDGIMVARGDLAVETPAAEVPIWQKTIVSKCLAAAKPVIVATQMLDSMIRNPRPTRAEISDVANAIIDHTDAVMLSGETATGKYPLEAVSTMATVAIETESSFFDDLHIHVSVRDELNVEQAMSKTAGLLARTMSAKAIVGTSLSGDTARQMSRFRPEIPVFIGTSDLRVMRQMNLSWGVWPFLVPAEKTEIGLKKAVFSQLKRYKVLKKGDKVIYVSGVPGQSGETNQVTIEKVS